ncbi:MAG TPA: nickel pincer cofactor biosynthesis protein LarC [Lachnospiraceae bacterium]|nr:nickel pincer cofactor biosynthesis protein LarC [Lachnospiraceae bacterium]
MEAKNQTLYLECTSGISGDMTVAALLDLGADQEVLKKALDSLSVEGFQTVISRVKKAGLDVCDFNVVLDAEHENHDHDMEYLHGHSHAEKDDNPHLHEHDHAHTHAHEHHHHHPHSHRGLSEILSIIEHADMTRRAKDTAARIFKILAAAEAKAHGVPEDQVHFHEVGAVDSIVDILSVAVCLDNLDITEVIVPALYEGQGTIRCQHGILPVPVPAVMNIVQAHKLPLQVTDIKGELVTPTGAAIVAAIRTSDRLPDLFTIEKTGMGAGKRDYGLAGILRAMLIHSGAEEKDRIYKLETNIDDCSGENLGYTMERLMEEGARDVHYIPVYMKKNRPAYQLNVICDEGSIERMEQIIFEETTTIGIRRIPMERTTLLRECRTVQTPLGEAKVKVCQWQGVKRYFPEYDSVTALCRAHGLHYHDVYQLIQRIGEEN